MANKKKITLTGGVVIDSLNIKKDLFYYKIPPFLVDKVKVGSRVSVPFGPKDIEVSAFLFTIEEKKEDKSLKEIQSVISPPLFDEQTRDLILFVAKTFFIPLHTFVNKTLKGLTPEIYRRFVVCQFPEKLSEELKNFTGKKKEIAEFVLQRKVVPVSVLKKHFGTYHGKILRSLEEDGFLERISVSEKYSLPYIRLNVSREKLESVLDLFEDKNSKSSAATILARLINAGSPLREDVLKKGVRYGKRIINFLAKNNVLVMENIRTFDEKSATRNAKFSLVCGVSLAERTEKLISSIKKMPEGKILVVFPELSLLGRVSDIYKREFGDRVFVWDGKNKRKLIEAIFFKEKDIFLVTPFALFVKIPNLKRLILEGASSRYFKKTDFMPFDTLVTSVKKARLEKLELIFSSPVPEENIFYLMQKGVLKEGECETSTSKFDVKIIDMREEFKKRNFKILSIPLQQKIKSVLRNTGNVALLLNRKSYSTFVMCRECGYVMRCPNCDVPLYYDKEKNLLFCHICGYSEKPPNVCPRCGSTNIRYFSGGIQKLEEEVRKMFPGARIVKLVSGKGKEIVMNSENFEKTIFIGTEFLVSHLNLSNVSAFGFVGADIFLNKFSFDASVETFSIISDIATEMKGLPVYVQTYIPEHFVFAYVKHFDFKHFFKEEFEMRKALNYPPFKNLIVFTFCSKDKEQAKNNAENFKNSISQFIKNGGNIYGPSPSAVEKKGELYYFEVSVKSKEINENIRDKYIDLLNAMKSRGVFVEPYISIKEGME